MLVFRLLLDCETALHRATEAIPLRTAMLDRRAGNAFRNTAEQQMLSVATQIFDVRHVS